MEMKMNVNEILECLIGKTKEDAIKLCLENEYQVRIMRIDTNIYFGTMDLNPIRVNLEIDNGLITKCDIG